MIYSKTGSVNISLRCTRLFITKKSTRRAGYFGVIYLLGGLAPDSDQPMAEEMREYIQNTWQKIQQRIPGTEFNLNFWKNVNHDVQLIPPVMQSLRQESKDKTLIFR